MKKNITLPENPSVLDIEEYEEAMKDFENVSNKPAVVSFWLSLLFALCSVADIIFFALKPIMYYKNMIGYEGWFYMFNIYRIASGYGFAALFVVFGIVILRLCRRCADADAEYQKYRKITGILCIVGFCLIGVVIAVISVQTVGYFADLDTYKR